MAPLKLNSYGGAWRIYITFTDGTKTSLGAFGTAGYGKIKELYGDLIETV